MLLEDLGGGAAGDGAAAAAAAKAAADAGAAGGQGGDDQESFFDPSQLPDELKPTWKKMQASFTKKMQGLSSGRQDLDMLAKFREDPEFAKQLIRAEAQRLGLQFADTGQAAGAGAGGTAAGGPRPDPALTEAIRSALPPELQWMAPALAVAQATMLKTTVEPQLQKQKERDQAERQTQYEELAEELSEIAPGWEEHEDDMLDLLGFLSSGAQTHRKWGSKLALLHSVVTGGGTAAATAARRMGDAARQRMVTGQAGRAGVDNVDERVKKAATNAEAWEIASKHAQQVVGGAR